MNNDVRNDADLPAHVQRLLEAIRGNKDDSGAVKRTGLNEWLARSPLREDKDPSLSITLKDDGKLLLYDHAEGEGATPDILDALELSWDDLFPVAHDSEARHVDAASMFNPDLARKLFGNRTEGRIRKGYVHKLSRDIAERFAASIGLPTSALLQFDVGYSPERDALIIAEQDRYGGVVGLVARRESGQKRAMTGSKRGLTGTGFLHRTGRLHIGEGFTDAVALASIGLHEIVGRPSSSSGTDELLHLVKESGYRQVVLFADSDKPGQAGAAKLAHALATEVPVRIVTPPRGFKDVRHWVVEGGANREEIERAIQSARPIEAARSDGYRRRLDVVRMSAVEAREVEWLFENRIPRAAVSIIAGEPGVNKSFLTCHLAAAITTGRPFHPTSPATNPAEVVMLNAEDDPSTTVRPRLDAAGAVCSRVLFVRSAIEPGNDQNPVQRSVSLDRDIGMLDELLAQHPRVAAIFIDPINAYLGGIGDVYKDTDIRKVLTPLGELARKHNIAVIAVTHFTKGGKQASPNPLYRVVGSIGFVGAARSVSAVLREPGQGGDTGRRFWTSVMQNLAPDRGQTLAFRLEHGRLVFEEKVVDLEASDLFEQNPVRRTEAMNFLEALLRDGPLWQSDIEEQARAGDIAPRTLKRAKKSLGISSVKDGFGEGACWFWHLPQHGGQRPHDTSAESAER